MKKILLPALLFCCLNNIIAQPADSLLKKFKYRIDNFRAIGFNADAGSQFAETDLFSGKQTNSSSGGDLGVSYYTTKSTDRILLTASAGVYGSFNRSKSDDQITRNTNHSFSTVPQLSLLNKWFTKKMFTELGTNMYANYYTQKRSTTGFATDAKNKAAQYSVAVTAGIGTGRLENITDMQNALWLYKELIKVDRLGAILSVDDLLALGSSITKGNNTRILDSRKRTQFLLTTVDNYLQQKGAISKTDMAYFSNLNDILFFAFNNQRLSGTEKFIRLTPAITGRNGDQLQNNGSDKSKNEFSTQSVLLATGFKKYSPVNLSHQNNYGAAIQLSYTDTDLHDRYFNNGLLTTEIKSNSTIKQAGTNLFYEHAIYPNTRTNINVGLQADLGYQDVDTKHFYCTVNLGTSVNYFISYRTRLTVGVNGYYQKNKYASGNYFMALPKTFQLSAGAGLQVNL
jgi:hypothetical protein